MRPSGRTSARKVSADVAVDSVLALVFGEERPEPGLHDEPRPVVVGEVILQGGDVGLETTSSEHRRAF